MILRSAKNIAAICIFIPFIVLGCAKENSVQNKNDEQVIEENRQVDSSFSKIEILLEEFLEEYTYDVNSNQEWIVYECVPKKGSVVEQYGDLEVKIKCNIDSQLCNFKDVSEYVENFFDYEVIRQVQNEENKYGITKIYEVLGTEHGQVGYIIYFEDTPNFIWLAGRNVLEGKLLPKAPTYKELLEETKNPIVQ